MAATAGSAALCGIGAYSRVHDAKFFSLEFPTYRQYTQPISAGMLVPSSLANIRYVAMADPEVVSRGGELRGHERGGAWRGGRAPYTENV